MEIWRSLRNVAEREAIEVSERGGKAVESQCQLRGDFLTSVANQALPPCQPPMRALSSRDRTLPGFGERFRRRRGSQSHTDRFGADHSEPVAPNVTTRP